MGCLVGESQDVWVWMAHNGNSSASIINCQVLDKNIFSLPWCPCLCVYFVEKKPRNITTISTWKQCEVRFDGRRVWFRTIPYNVSVCRRFFLEFLSPSLPLPKLCCCSSCFAHRITGDPERAIGLLSRRWCELASKLLLYLFLHSTIKAKGLSMQYMFLK